jgi:hypothetical protein
LSGIIGESWGGDRVDSSMKASDGFWGVGVAYDLVEKKAKKIPAQGRGDDQSKNSGVGYSVLKS